MDGIRIVDLVEILPVVWGIYDWGEAPALRQPRLLLTTLVKPNPYPHATRRGEDGRPA